MNVTVSKAFASATLILRYCYLIKRIALSLLSQLSWIADMDDHEYHKDANKR